MSFTTVEVQGLITLADGTPAQDYRLKIELSNFDQDSSLVIHEPIYYDIPNTGIVSINLWPNSKGITGSHYDVYLFPKDTSDPIKRSFTLVVPESATPVSIWDLIALLPPPAQSVVQDALIELNLKIVAIDQSVVAASTSATTSVSSAQASEISRVASVAAKTSSESARDTSNISRDQSVTASTASQLAQTNAETARDEAVVAQGLSEAAANSIGSSVTAASNSEANALASMNTAAQEATDSATSAAEALASKNGTDLDRIAAAASALAALNSGTLSTASKDAAAISETNAATSETNVAADLVLTNADALSTSLDAISTNADSVSTGNDVIATANVVAAVTAIYDDFDDRYLGAKSAHPTVDNDGDPLQVGMLYFNTSSNSMKVRSGVSTWLDAYASLSGALIASNNLSDLASDTTSRTNLGVSIGSDVQAHSSVLDNTTASYTLGEETKLSNIEANANVNRAISDSISVTSSTQSASSTSVKTAHDKGVEALALANTKANSSHTHTIANVTNLQTALDGKLGDTEKAADTDKVDGIAFKNANTSNFVSDPDSFITNGIGYTKNANSILGENDGSIISQAHSTPWIHQIYGDYRSGQMAIRGKNNSVWGAWRTVWDSVNSKQFTDALKAKLDGISASADVNSPISHSVTSTSLTNVASSKAVKEAYDKGVAADNNANGRLFAGGTAVNSLKLNGNDYKHFSGVATTSSTSDPNITVLPTILTNHANIPTGGGSSYYYINTYFWTNNGTSSNRAQTAVSYLSTTASMFTRHYYNGTWSDWVRCDNDDPDLMKVSSDTDLRMNALHNIRRYSHSSGMLVGSYNSVGANGLKSNPIYTIGDNYKPTDGALGGMYGIGFSQSIWGTADGRPQGWGLYVCAAGTAKAIMSEGTIWASVAMKVGVNTVWHAGNDGAGSGLDADKLDGLELGAAANTVANKVVRTDVSGYIYSGWINTISGVTTAAISNIYVETGSDKFLRKCTPTHLKSQLGIVAAASPTITTWGTWYTTAPYVLPLFRKFGNKSVSYNTNKQTVAFYNAAANTAGFDLSQAVKCVVIKIKAEQDNATFSVTAHTAVGGGGSTVDTAVFRTGYTGYSSSNTATWILTSTTANIRSIKLPVLLGYNIEIETFL